MLIKLYLAVFVIGLSYAAGYLYTLRYVKKEEYFSGLIRNFLQIEAQMEYSRTALPDLFSNVAEEGVGPGSTLFSLCAEKMKENGGMEFSTLWRESVEEAFQKTSLSSEEKEKIKNLGELLGKTDLYEQKKNFLHIKGELDVLFENAHQVRVKNTKLLRSAFTSFGIMIVIILI